VSQDVAEFIDANVKLNEKGKPWALSEYQRTVLAVMFLRHYSIRLWSEIKKSGKTFLAACIAIFEAITNPDCEIVCCANDEEQAVSRVFQTVVQLIKYNAELTRSATVQAAQVKFTNGSVIRAVSSDYKGQAGGRQRLTIFDELWAFELERMTRLFEELTPPATESGAYILIVSYAGFVGEGDLLEKLYQRGLKGRRIHKSLEVYRAEGLCMFWSHRRRQPWQVGPEGRAYYAEQRRILRPNTFRRLHGNEWVSAESQFISAEQWDAIVDESRSPILAGASVCLGIDIGVKSDTSAVVGAGWDNDGKKVIVAFHKIWRPTKGHPVILGDVKDYIKEVSQRHAIRKAVADPSQAYRLIEELGNEGITVEEFTQGPANGVKMGETLFSLVKDRNLIAYPSDELRGHVLNATAIETPGGVRMTKSKNSKKIDAGIALAMACVAAIEKGPGTSIAQMIANNAGIPDRSIGGAGMDSEGVFSCQGSSYPVAGGGGPVRISADWGDDADAARFPGLGRPVSR